MCAHTHAFTLERKAQAAAGGGRQCRMSIKGQDKNTQNTQNDLNTKVKVLRPVPRLCDIKNRDKSYIPPHGGFVQVFVWIQHFGCLRTPAGTTYWLLHSTDPRSRVHFFVKSVVGMWSVCDDSWISLCCLTCLTCPGAYVVSTKLIMCVACTIMCH